MGGKLTNYCDFCQWHLFCDIVRLQYDGTVTYNNHRVLHNIYLELSGLKLLSKVNGEIISLTLDILYQRYVEFLPLLLFNATSWSFSLVILFITFWVLNYRKLLGLMGIFYLIILPLPHFYSNDHFSDPEKAICCCLQASIWG